MMKAPNRLVKHWFINRKTKNSFYKFNKWICPILIVISLLGYLNNFICPLLGQTNKSTNFQRSFAIIYCQKVFSDYLLKIPKNLLLEFSGQFCKTKQTSLCLIIFATFQILMKISNNFFVYLLWVFKLWKLRSEVGLGHLNDNICFMCIC